MLARLIEHRGRALLCVAAALGLAGLVAGLRLPIGLFPVASFPRIRIEVDAGSMPARQMLLEVTQPLEEQARAVPGALDVQSTTSRGSAQIFVDFPWRSDMNQALLRVDSALAQTLPDLPAGTTYAAIQLSPTALMPFASYALVSDQVSPAALRRLAQYQIAPRLTGIGGIRRVGVLGGQTPEVEVSVSPQRLQAYGLTLADVAGALSATNAISAVGRLEDNDLLYLAIADNAFTSPRSVSEVVLRTGRSGIVRLSDVATVAAGSVPQWLLVNDNGKPAVTLDVYQQDSADALGLARSVDASLAAFMRTQPPSIQLYKWYDQTQLVRSSIGAMAEAILIGLAFAALVVLGALRNWRAAVVAMTVVPLAVLITVLVMYLLGMTFNIMTLGGVAAAIGLLIDDAIVMIEHIARRAGVPGLPQPHAAVLPAAREFLTPLFGSSLATVIIFIPLAFLSGITGAFFRFLSLTMVSALVVSCVLTALIVPLLARGLIDFNAWHDPAHGRESRLTRWHGRALRGLFAHPWLIAAGVAMLIAAALAAYEHVGTGFLPRMDEGGFVLDYQSAPGTSLAESNRELGQVEAILKANPYVYTYSRRTGAGLGGDLKESYQGDFFVRLVDSSRRPPLWQVMDRVNADITARVPGIQLDPHQLLDDMIGDMVGRPQPVVIQLSAANPDVLDGVAVKVADALGKVPGIVPDSVNNGVIPAGDALEVHVDPAAAAALGATVAEVQSQLYHYLYGSVVTHYLGTVQDVGVRLRLQASQDPLYRADLGQLLMRSPDGRVFPLRSVARIGFVSGQPQITRDNLAQVVPVTAEIGGGHDLGSTIAAVRQSLQRPGLLPPGVYYSIGGAYRQQQLALAGMIKVFAAATAAEFILLLFLYNRLWLPLIIIVSAVLSSGAVFIGLWLTGTQFNITAMMGMVMIIGIATEMAIFFASEYQALEQTMPPRAALQAAALNRLRPIAMSTLAMILALLPLGAALSGSGDQMLQPLAIAIIAGIVVQLPLVLLVMPVLIGLTRRASARAHPRAADPAR
ncbi:MAG TPA: efflux RND transporter permease subunit [Steroidobacteraceae bacterium]|jgi:multidrug efflux pump subunit AcrB|nr:efflux RND transporter permease subunit [Steroidobacteraceae bacterium]